MYVGRIVAIGRTAAGANAGLYRVSSRSFPNRVAVENERGIAVVPRAGHEGDIQKNPYIAYNAARLSGRWAVVTNGSHCDPIAEKLDAGAPPRDALALCLLAMDYEKDSYCTPRIAGIVPAEGDTGWLATVRRDGLTVKELPLEAGRAFFLATYETDDVRTEQVVDGFTAADAEAAARFVFDGGGFADLEKPVTSVAALAKDGAFACATYTREP